MAAFYGDNFSQDGRLFNRDGKTQIMEVLFCGGDLLKLAGLIVKEAWLRDDGEGYAPNTKFLLDMREAFLLDHCEMLSTLAPAMQEAIRRGSQWLIVLYRNDQMYFERIGGCIMFVIYEYPNHPPGTLLAKLREWYFVNEQRQDRVEHMRRVFALMEERYEKDGWVRRAVDWCFRYLYEHRDGFVWQIPSAEIPDRCVYDPVIWAGSRHGRGQDWFRVNGGKG